MITDEGNYNPDKAYDRLTTVRYNNAFWRSRKPVPAGNIPAEKSEYWALEARDGGAGILHAGENITITENEDGSKTISGQKGGYIAYPEITADPITGTLTFSGGQGIDVGINVDEGCIEWEVL